MRNMSSPAAAARMKASLVGRQRTTLTASSLLNLTLKHWRPVCKAQTRTVPSSPPLARYSPQGDTASVRTRPSWPWNTLVSLISHKRACNPASWQPRMASRE